MLKRVLFVLAMVLAFSVSAWGQTTTVTGTVADANGNAYFPGTVSASVVLNTGQPLPVGVPASGSIGPFATTSGGNFSVTVASPLIWVFTICGTPTSIGPRGNSTPSQVCFPTSAIAISGASQVITGNLPTVPIIGPGGSSSGLTSGNGPPSPSCSAGVGYTDNLTGNFYTCDAGTFVLVGPQSGGNTNLIDPRLLGVLADVKIFYSSGSTLGVTNGSSVVTCSNCNFTSADVGKNIEATTNSCCGVGAMINGTLALASTPITSVTNPTTVSVSPATAIATLSGGNGTLGYGHYDDTGWDLVDAAINGSANCSTVIIPAGYSAIKKPHGNQVGTSHLCNTTTPGHNYNYTWKGYGKYTSMFVLMSDFDFTLCNTPTLIGGLNGCSFNLSQSVLEDFGMTGLGYGNTGNHSVALMSPGIGSEVSNINLLSFAGTDASSVGFYFNSTRAKFLAVDGFGAIAIKEANPGGIATNSSGCFYCFAESNNDNINVTVGPYVDNFSQYGICQVTGCANVDVSSGGVYYGFATSSFFESSAFATTSAVGLWAKGGTIYQYGGTWDLSGSASSDGGAATGTGIIHSCNATYKGGSGAGFSMTTQNTAKFFDDCPNTFSSATSFVAGSVFGSASGTGTNLAANCASFLTSGWATSTCAAVVNSDKHAGRFTITAAGAPGAGPVFTLPFPAPYLVAPASCSFQQTGGTFGVLTNPVAGTPTTTTCTMTLTGTAIATQTYQFDYRVGP